MRGQKTPRAKPCALDAPVQRQDHRGEKKAQGIRPPTSVLIRSCQDRPTSRPWRIQAKARLPKSAETESQTVPGQQEIGHAPGVRLLVSHHRVPAGTTLRHSARFIPARADYFAARFWAALVEAWLRQRDFEDAPFAATELRFLERCPDRSSEDGLEGLPLVPHGAVTPEGRCSLVAANGKDRPQPRQRWSCPSPCRSEYQLFLAMAK